jgi:glyoxylase-like metal-dependent hydrolase (beta-lactamase superfamily II)
VWEGDRHQINDELTIIKCGGHFEGASVLHWSEGDGGKGILFSGDTIQIVMDRKNVSFMYSYPNLIPLSAEKVDEIVNRVKPFKFDKIYGAFRGRHILENARSAVIESAERYKRAIASYKK